MHQDFKNEGKYTIMLRAKQVNIFESIDLINYVILLMKYRTGKDENGGKLHVQCQKRLKLIR